MRFTARMKSIVVIAALASLLSFAGVAYADETAQDSGVWRPAFSVTTDKSSYSGDEKITVTATALNDVEEYNKKQGGSATEDQMKADMSLSIQVPDGYKVVSGSATASAEDVPSGSKAAAQVVLAKSSSATAGQASVTSNSSTAKTGDFLSSASIAAGLAVLLAVIVLVVVMRRKNKDLPKHMLCGLLALSLVAGLSPFALLDAQAEEQTEEQAGSQQESGALDTEHDATGSVTVQVDGNTVTINAKVACGLDKQDHVYATDDGGYTTPSDEDVLDPKVKFSISGATASPEGDGYRVTMDVDAQIYLGEGALDLTQANVSVEDSYVADGSGSAYDGTLEVIGKGSMKATRVFSANEVQSFVSEGDDASSDLISRAVFDLSGHKITIDGALKNSAGDPMASTTVNPVIAFDVDGASLSADDVALATDSSTSRSKTAMDSLAMGKEFCNAVAGFIKFFAEDKADGFATGCGGILGIAEKAIAIPSDTQGAYTMGEVVKRIDQLSSSVDAISGQVSSINQHLDQQDKRYAWQNKVDNITSLIASANVYVDDMSDLTCKVYKNIADEVKKDNGASDEASTSAVDNTVVTKVDLSEIPQRYQKAYLEVTADFNKMNDANKEAFTKYAAFIKKSEGSSNEKTALDIAMALAQASYGEGNIGLFNANSVYRSYFNYVDSFFNWETEVYDIRKCFAGQYESAFGVVYMSSMAELSVDIATSTDAATVQSALSRRASLIDAATKMTDVSQSEDVESALTERTDGKVKNLVNGYYFDANFKRAHFNVAARTAKDPSGNWIANCPEITFIPKNREIDDAKLLDGNYSSQLDSDIKQEDFLTMFRNLKYIRGLEGYGDVKSLAAEMIKVGLLGANYKSDPGLYYDWYYYRGFKWSESKDQWVINYVKGVPDKGKTFTPLDWGSELSINSKEGDPNLFYLSTNKNPTKDKDIDSVEHVRTYYGTFADIEATSESKLIVEDHKFYTLDRFYKAGHRWYVQVTYWPASVAGRCLSPGEE